MTIKCSDIENLKSTIESAFNTKPDVSDIGKSIYRINGLTCTIYDTETVLLQGKNVNQTKEHIINLVELINHQNRNA